MINLGKSVVPIRCFLSATVLLLSAFGTMGCGANLTSDSSFLSTTHRIQGSVFGGQQPVVGAAIQLFAAGMPTSGGSYGQGSTPLITGPLPVTDSNGFFSITGDYLPPSTPSYFYIVATGGNPGLNNTVNPDIVLMSVFGSCTPTNGLSPSLFVNINEVTTIASVWALQSFMAAPSIGNFGAPVIGGPSSAYNSLQNAFEMAQGLVNTKEGSATTPSNNWATTIDNGLRINTLASILATCVNSVPYGPCSTLFSDATPSVATNLAADTVQTAWYIAQNPANNVAALFDLVSARPAFMGLSSAPTDFNISTANAAVACQQPVSLGSAANFAVLAGSTITSTGMTAVSGGNIGLYPGTSITGFPSGVLSAPAVMDISDSSATQAEIDLTNAYNGISALLSAAVLPADLSGLTLTPGLYMTATTAQLSSTLTLDGHGDPGAIFIFQIGTTLTTAGSTEVILVNGAQAKNIFWQVGTSATLGANSLFKGTIIALTSITLNANAALQGRALASTGAVTLIGNTITAP